MLVDCHFARQIEITNTHFHQHLHQHQHQHKGHEIKGGGDSQGFPSSSPPDDSEGGSGGTGFAVELTEGTGGGGGGGGCEEEEGGGTAGVAVALAERALFASPPATAPWTHAAKESRRSARQEAKKDLDAILVLCPLRLSLCFASDREEGR